MGASFGVPSSALRGPQARVDEGPALPQSCVLLWAPVKTHSDRVRAALRHGVCRLWRPAKGGRGSGSSLSGMGVSPTLQAVASLTGWLADVTPRRLKHCHFLPIRPVSAVSSMSRDHVT